MHVRRQALYTLGCCLERIPGSWRAGKPDAIMNETKQRAGNRDLECNRVELRRIRRREGDRSINQSTATPIGRTELRRIFWPGERESAIKLKGLLMVGYIPRESSVTVRTLKLHRRPGREYFSAAAPLPAWTPLRPLPWRIGPSLLQRWTCE